MKYISKIILSIGLFLGITSPSNAQIVDPVDWETSVEKHGDNRFTLVAKATIGGHYHMYSQTPTDGPIPTTFTFLAKGIAYRAEGKTIEPKGVTKFEEVFGVEVKYFEKEAVFRQKITLLKEDVHKIQASVEFMVCDDQSCLPPKEDDLIFDLDKAVAVATSSADTESETAGSAENDMDSKKSKGLWSVFLIAFLSGFFALLTPCVFPMIPMTVSFFTKQSKSKGAGIRNAVFYGISIIVIYVLLGTVVTAIFGADALNALSTSVWFNLIFFAILIIFAVSFLGGFELTLPSSWGTKIDKQSDKGGLIGIFFMALALAVVSFSCTGPIVGTLLVEAASKGGIAPLIGMFGFSLAIALPFTIFAIFPSWLNSMPKSGGWLNTVKVVLGFLELALAFKFLSNADLVTQAHLLEREVFIAIWIAIFGAMALYLFAKIRLPHDSPTEYISVGRLSLAIITLAFTVYMVPGLWGAPLNLVNAFLPPSYYSESPGGVGKGGGSTTTASNHHDANLPEGAHLMEPHNIVAFDDYEKGLAYAKKVGKPMLLDFTGWACVNCRKMEQNVWMKPEVLSLLQDKVVMVSLYVDDKRPLTGDPIASKIKEGKQLKYIGQKWSELQVLRYKTNTQPFYVLMDQCEENLTTPISYTPDVATYRDWLNKGISNYQKERSCE